MSAPSDLFAFDIDAARAAAERWRAHAAEREPKKKEIDRGRIGVAEPEERLAKRFEHLSGMIERTGGSVAAADLASRAREASGAEATADKLERILGETRDFLGVAFLERGAQASRAVGRIVTTLDNGRKQFGTGFMVSPRLLMTNHHVLTHAEVAARSTIEFNYQLTLSGNGNPEPFALEPDRFFINDRELDFALVAVEARPGLAAYGWCPLIATEGKITIGEFVNIVQHPSGRQKEVVIRENKLVDLPTDADRFAYYMADTEPGSSGSPVFNDQWEVIALHHSGVPKTDRNGNLLAIDNRIWRDGDDPARLAWVANEGIRISRLMRFIDSLALSGEQQGLRAELQAARPPSSTVVAPPAPPTPRPAIEVSPSPSPSASSGSVTVTVPLRITISLGDITAGGTGSTLSVAPDLQEAVRPLPDYSARPGYDPDFIGERVPMPTLGNRIARDAARLADGGTELKYFHYSVLFSSRRRLAFVVGVNFDPNAPFTHQRKDKDRWFFDPRLDEAVQAGEAYYRNNPFDRGHLARRADSAWGATAEEAKQANDDTFHFTNCSPQHMIFNQGLDGRQRGVALWGGIETHIASQGRDQKLRLSIFNGPVLASDDPIISVAGEPDLQVPREFFKVVVSKGDDGGLRALGFILSQGEFLADLRREQFEPGEFQTFQVKIREIETRTKLDFGDLRRADPLEAQGREARFEAGTEAVALGSLADIVL